MLMDKNDGDDYEFLKDLDLTKSQYLPLKETHSECSFSNVFESNQSLCGNNTMQSCFFNDPFPNCNQDYLSDKKLNPENILEETSIDITKNINFGDCLLKQIERSQNSINNTITFEKNFQVIVKYS